jgi:hypothetical protein
MDGTDVYELILRGELAAGKGKDGLVYVRESALEATDAATPQPPAEPERPLARSTVRHDVAAGCVAARRS